MVTASLHNQVREIRELRLNPWGVWRPLLFPELPPSACASAGLNPGEPLAL